MKLIVSLILTILLAYVTFLYSSIIPWWGAVVGAFLVGILVPQKAWLSWLAGFLGVFICWTALCWYISYENNGLLAAKMSLLVMPFFKGSDMAIILLSALVGGVVSGLAALSGAFLRKKRPMLAA